MNDKDFVEPELLVGPKGEITEAVDTVDEAQSKGIKAVVAFIQECTLTCTNPATACRSCEKFKEWQTSNVVTLSALVTRSVTGVASEEQSQLPVVDTRKVVKVTSLISGCPFNPANPNREKETMLCDEYPDCKDCELLSRWKARFTNSTTSRLEDDYDSKSNQTPSKEESTEEKVAEVVTEPKVESVAKVTFPDGSELDMRTTGVLYKSRKAWGITAYTPIRLHELAMLMNVEEKEVKEKKDYTNFSGRIEDSFKMPKDILAKWADVLLEFDTEVLVVYGRKKVLVPAEMGPGGGEVAPAYTRAMWMAVAPKQEVTSYNVDVDNFGKAIELLEFNGYNHMGSIHTHPGGMTGHSGTDEKELFDGMGGIHYIIPRNKEVGIHVSLGMKTWDMTQIETLPETLENNEDAGVWTEKGTQDLKEVVFRKVYTYTTYQNTGQGCYGPYSGQHQGMGFHGRDESNNPGRDPRFSSADFRQQAGWRYNPATERVQWWTGDYFSPNVFCYDPVIEEKAKEDQKAKANVGQGKEQRVPEITLANVLGVGNIDYLFQLEALENSVEHLGDYPRINYHTFNSITDDIDVLIQDLELIGATAMEVMGTLRDVRRKLMALDKDTKGASVTIANRMRDIQLSMFKDLLLVAGKCDERCVSLITPDDIDYEAPKQGSTIITDPTNTGNYDMYTMD